MRQGTKGSTDNLEILLVVVEPGASGLGEACAVLVELLGEDRRPAEEDVDVVAGVRLG